MNRRNFVRNTLASLIPITLGAKEAVRPNFRFFESTPELNFSDKSINSKYWKKVRTHYTLSKDLIDFNNAGLNPSPVRVLKELEKRNEQSNKIPSFVNWEERKMRKSVVRLLAEMANCSPEELVLLRNTTEAMTVSIAGIKLIKGDEVIVGKYDYPHIYEAWRARALRDGIKLVYVDLGPYPKSKAEIIKQYLSAVTKKTRGIHLTQIQNHNGLLVPVKEILNQLPERVQYKLVDGAQSFGHIEVDLRALNCTHFGTSLHKWCGGPRGTGFLFVKKNMIKKTRPLFSNHLFDSNIIEKFSAFGTINYAADIALEKALEFQKEIGVQNKIARFLELKNHWQNKLKINKKIEIYQTENKELHSGIGIFRLVDSTIDLAKFAERLRREFGIHTTSVHWEKVKAIRISPNVYHNKKELDKFVDAVNYLSAH